MTPRHSKLQKSDHENLIFGVLCEKRQKVGNVGQKCHCDVTMTHFWMQEFCHVAGLSRPQLLFTQNHRNRTSAARSVPDCVRLAGVSPMWHVTVTPQWLWLPTRKFQEVSGGGICDCHALWIGKNGHRGGREMDFSAKCWHNVDVRHPFPGGD